MVSSESTTLVISDHPQKNGNSIKKTQKKWKQLKVKLLAKGIKPHPSNEQPSTTISAQNQHLPPNGRGGGLLSLKPLDRLDLAPSTLLPTLAHQDNNFKAQHLLWLLPLMAPPPPSLQPVLKIRRSPRQKIKCPRPSFTLTVHNSP